MRKLFFAIYFISCFFVLNKTFAAVSTLEEAAAASSESKGLEPITPEGLPNPKNIEEVREFFKERFNTAVVSDASDLGDLNKSNSMDIQHSAEYIQKMQENKKSVFERIYDEMMSRLNHSEVEFSPDTVFYEKIKAIQNEELPDISNLRVVRVTLPNGNSVLAPAREHIPYLLSSYHILPTGMIEVDEEVVVIVNSDRLRRGLVKALPKYTTSRSHVKKKVQVDLLSVHIDGKEIPYKLQEIGNDIVFVPKEKYILDAGVYTYHFKYLLNRKLWYYDEFTEFYTDVVGSYSNLVIASANAVVSVPDGRHFMSQLAMVGKPNNLSPNRTRIVQLSSNALGFASLVPLGRGDNMHILVSLDKNIFNEPSLGQRFVWMVMDYGDILFTLLGFILIYGSYYLSWKYIKANKSRLIIRFKQTAPLNRYIFKEKYDKRSFVSALLDLVRYKIIDIKKENTSYLLIKKTDVLKKLPSGLKRVVNCLFTKSDSSIEVGSKNKLKFERAMNKHEDYVKTYFKFLVWRLNGYYLIFSVSMFLLTLGALAYLAVNPVEMMLILVSTTMTLAFYLWILQYPFASKWIRYSVRVTGSFFVVLTILILSVYMHLISAILLALIVGVILEYSRRFSAKNGLIKNKAQDLKTLYKYLKENVTTVGQSKEFDAQQANIFAFELEDKYTKNAKNEKSYRLDLAENILKLL